ncbi:hypothetical protein FHG64_00370 [Antarcticibacterium flavum]|uniref:Nicotinate-nucleotide adenylyltransferase n=1 Tax=Antarcticibacterium flavum TaxID=2058175 RepID=A0A5B7X035_9FLAO|nr:MULTISPECIES: hypothetical protein [Antarcticibacterium]MCM4160801.1 hypothetical protein [Antarcticibacterium sp. W02-3]QCY67971.1 hypothetical protein FHG64_00370 [Antarcticibacterium flavum]
MKKVILCLLLFGFLTTGQAQKVIELEVLNLPDVMMVKVGKDATEYKIQELYENEFSSNSIGFIKEFFDMKRYLATVKKEKYDSYEITFKSKRGNVLAFYDKNGEWIKNFQNFKNVELPRNITEYLVTDYNGWTMIRNRYKAKGKEDKIDKEIFVITLKNGNKKQTLRLDAEKETGLATHYKE